CKGRAAVTDEDEGLHDLRARRADGLRRRTRGRRPLRELLDPRVDACALEHVGDPRDRLRPGLHRGTVTRNPGVLVGDGAEFEHAGVVETLAPKLLDELR